MKKCWQIDIKIANIMDKKEQEEIWKKIPMFPTYAASNLGRIKNIKKDKLMAQKGNDNRNYQRVCISHENKAYTKRVARLIWAAFNECDCPQTIDHIDGNVLNNNIENLKCVSIKENCMNKNTYGKRINKYNLDDTKKREILTAYKNKEKTVWKLSWEYSIPTNYLYTTFNRGSWEHLCLNEDTNNTYNSQNE
jgi:hypothetical protein